MDLWMDLLFGNPIGLFSVITVGATLAVFIFIVSMLYWRSTHQQQDH